ncbi:MAG TPA: class I SAM-dependent methyltransferase [Gemmatimonadaceae bacterium]|jgi:ubiquinone/menaquinone biosynthesis C-methylase UbiE
MRGPSAALRQEQHYERVHDDYERHYYDSSSMAFRNQFVYDIMFDGIDLNGKVVADVASGSGHNSLAVLQRFPRAKIIGFDISSKACKAYERITGAKAYQIDLTSGADCGVVADVAMVIGGIHHCATNLSQTFKTISHIVRPGGLLLMCEPNRQYILEGARRVWYQLDRYFDQQTEAALEHEAIAKLASVHFSPVSCRYMGGPAYLLIYNSLLFRLPRRVKSTIAPPLIALERFYNLLPGRWWYPYFIARWQRTHR